MYFEVYIRWKFRKHYGKHSGHGSVHLWHHSGISLFLFLLWSSATNVNQSTNFCLTTLESWNFLIKREVLVVDTCGKSCCLFSTKNCLRILPESCSGCLLHPLAVYQWSIVSYQQGFLEYILCKSNPHQHQNKQAENSQDVACQGWASVKLTRLENFCSDWKLNRRKK